MEEPEEEESSEEEDEFYVREMQLMREWQRYEAKILPRQYWRDERSTLFCTKPEMTFFDDQPLEEYN